MTNKKELTASIAAMYFGCNIQITHPDCEPFITKMRSVGKYWIGYQTADGKETFELFETQKCKLILKPLSEILPEHAIEVAKIIDAGTLYGFGDPTYKFDIVEGYSYTKECRFKQPIVRVLDSNGNNYGYKIIDLIADGMCSLEIIDLLRSRGYDCGYGSIPSLIQSGIAITQAK